MNPRPPRTRPHPYDVVVVGGGPAGAVCTAALGDAGHRVHVHDAIRSRPPTVEQMSGRTTALLAHALAWTYDGPAVTETVTRWGAMPCVTRSSMLLPGGSGTVVERAAFDAALVGRSRVKVERLRVTSIERTVDGWRVSNPTGTVTGRLLVLASGRSSPLLGRRPVRLRGTSGPATAVTGWCQAPATPPAGYALLVEQCADGWWWSLPHPHGGTFLGRWTDERFPVADVSAWWSNGLAATEIMGPLVGLDHTLAGPLVQRAATTGSWSSVGGPGWIAVGDAAFVTDPLSGQGLEFAVESGLRAAEAIGSGLAPSSAAGYASWVDDVVATHGQARNSYFERVD